MLTPKDFESLAVNHKTGVRIVGVGVNLCLYIEPPFEEISDDVLAVYDAFLEICPKDQLVWYMTNSMERHERVTTRTLGMPQTWLRSAKKNKKLLEFELKNNVSKYHSDTPDWKFHFVSRSRENRLFRKRANFIDVLFPCVYGEDCLSAFGEFAEYSCTRLPFLSGHAGYTFEVSRYYESRGAFAKAISLGMRYKEIDISEPEFSQVVKKHNGIKGVNWLTILGDTFAKQIAAAARKRSKRLTFNEVPGGLIIQAGEGPAVADGNRGEFIGAYRDAYTLVKPLIVKTPFPLRMPGNFEDRMDKTRRWVHRFEENE